MIDPDRVLRPLREAEPAIEQLETYASPAEFTEALRATSHAVERTLRILLRSDPSTPDDVRLRAMTPDDVPLDAVLTELRRRDVISLGLAGRVHEMQQALERSERGEMRAADADNAADVVRQVRAEVKRLAVRDTKEAPTPPARAVLPPGDEDLERESVVSLARRWAAARPLYLAGAAALLLVLIFAAVLLFGGDSEMERGVQAFREDRDGVAEQHFRAALREDDRNNTARLYLARILREQGRNQEALQILREAYALDAQDEAVLRELGYLLLQEDRPQLAADQFRRAVEINPDEPLNWIGVVESLRRAGSPDADEWLRRAPEEARTMLRQRAAPTPSSSGGTP